MWSRPFNFGGQKVRVEEGWGIGIGSTFYPFLPSLFAAPQVALHPTLLALFVQGELCGKVESC